MCEIISRPRFVISYKVADSAAVHRDKHICADIGFTKTAIHYGGYFEIIFAVSVVDGYRFANRYRQQHR